MTGVLGAQVLIPDVKTLSDSQVSELRDLVCEHLVVVIPSQSLTAQEQAEFSLRWGQAGVVPFIEPSPDHPNVIRVLKEASDGNAFNFGGSWHSDFLFSQNHQHLPCFTPLIFHRMVATRCGHLSLRPITVLIKIIGTSVHR